MKFEIKRVYEEPARADGTRILVDQLWPRGLSKEKAQVDLWLKDIAPSTDLCKWFSHDPSKWTEFQARYRRELKSKAEIVALLKEKAAKGPITLLYGAKDEVHNEACGAAVTASIEVKSLARKLYGFFRGRDIVV